MTPQGIYPAIQESYYDSTYIFTIDATEKNAY